MVGAAGFVLNAALFAVKTMRETKGAGSILGRRCGALPIPPPSATGSNSAGSAAFAVISGLFVAALTAARRGEGRSLAAAQDAALD